MLNAGQLKLADKFQKYYTRCLLLPSGWDVQLSVVFMHKVLHGSGCHTYAHSDVCTNFL